MQEEGKAIQKNRGIEEPLETKGNTVKEGRESSKERNHVSTEKRHIQKGFIETEHLHKMCKVIEDI